MSFFVAAYSPKGRRIQLGLGTERLEHALEDRDGLRGSYLRKSIPGWRVEAEDATGRVFEWADAETDVAAGAA